MRTLAFLLSICDMARGFCVIGHSGEVIIPCYQVEVSMCNVLLVSLCIILPLNFSACCFLQGALVAVPSFDRLAYRAVVRNLTGDAAVKKVLSSTDELLWSYRYVFVLSFFTFRRKLVRLCSGVICGRLTRGILSRFILPQKGRNASTGSTIGSRLASNSFWRGNPAMCTS